MLPRDSNISMNAPQKYLKVVRNKEVEEYVTNLKTGKFIKRSSSVNAYFDFQNL
jgi:hypothetical protein